MQNYDKLLLALLGNTANQEVLALFDMLPIGIELYNKKGVLVAVNQYDLDLYGFRSKASLIGMNIFYDEFVSPEFQERLAEEEEITMWHYYNYARLYTSKKSGKVKIYTRFRHVKDENGDTVGYVVLNIEDNTRPLLRKHADLQEGEDNFGSLRTHVVRDDDGTPMQIIATAMDDAVAQMFGYDKEELLDHNLLNTTLHIPYIDKAHKLNEDNRTFTFYYYAVKTRRYLKWTVIYQGNEDYYCRVCDVTRDLMKNQGVNFSQALFRTMFDKAPVAALFLDTRGYVEEANDYFMDIMGVRHKDDIIGYRISRDKSIDASDRFEMTSNEEFVVEQDFELDKEVFCNNSHDKVYVRIHTIKFYLPDGTHRGYIAYLTNLTLEKEKQEKLERLRAKAISESNMKSRFLQNMSHDVRTPLNAIVGFSQLLALPDGALTPEEKEEFSGHIANNSNMLMMLVDDILNISDIENGNYRITPRPVFCNELCNNTLKSVEYRVPANVKCYFTSDAADNETIVTDGRRVQQVLINFLTNACKHTTEGEIQLVCNIHKDPKRILFSVIDTGEGINPEFIDDLFERFAKDGVVEGSGLGLNICKTISQRLGGDVSYDPSYTNGAKFDFYIPKPAKKK